jgi:cation:H+ antiporter
VDLLAFEQHPLWVNVGLFALGAAIVWAAGTRLSRYADPVAERTGLGHAFIGALLLGGITSLPELATTLTASIGGNGPLAVNNVLGGVAMQVAILAVADALMGGRALSSVIDTSAVLLQGTGLILVLALTAAAITAGSVVVLGVDLWTLAIFVVALLSLYSIKQYEADPRWRPQEESAAEAAPGEAPSDLSTGQLAAWVAGAGLLVVGAGYLVARTGEAIAVQSGLGASFVGAILLAIATSLPEVSTTFEAVRLGHYRLAFSNIFGTNLLDVALLLVADIGFRGGGVLEEVGAFSQFGALLGLVLTAIYLMGLLQRRSRTVLRMGIDSALVLAVYLGGVGVLYSMR